MTPAQPRSVLFVITKSNWGGAQAYVYTLACAYAAQGISVTVAFGGTGAPGAGAGLLAEKLAAAGVRTIFIKAFMRDVGLRRDVNALRELVQLFRTEQPEVVHLNSSKAGGLGALAGRLAGVPRIVFTAHGWAHQESRAPLKRMAIALVSWLTVALAHRVIVLSQFERRRAPAWGLRRKLVVVPNGITAFPLQTREAARAQLATTTMVQRKGDEALWVLAVGELHPNKGFDVLITAFAQTCAHAPAAQLFIIGEGQERAQLATHIAQTACADRIHLCGFVADARSLLKAADVFVLSSRKEGLPFVVLEAGIAGCPVIATRVGALPEIITSPDEGVLVPAGDPTRLATALTELLNNAEKRTQLGAALRERVQTHFTQTAMVTGTLASYRA